MYTQRREQIGNEVTGTCERCSLTGSAIRGVLHELWPRLHKRNVWAEFHETVLTDEEIRESNQVIIDGRPTEDCLSGAEVVQTPCCSCACITGQDSAVCRAIEYAGQRYEAITPDLQKQVIIFAVEGGSPPAGAGAPAGTHAGTTSPDVPEDRGRIGLERKTD